MKLPPADIRKLFRETFSGHRPLRFDPSVRSDTSTWWRDQIQQIDGTKLTKHPGDKDSRSRILCRFTIPGPDGVSYDWRSDELRIEHNRQDNLILRSPLRHGKVEPQTNSVAPDPAASNPLVTEPIASDPIALISGVHEVVQFVDAVRKRYAIQNARAKQRATVRDFKVRAMIANVRRIAAAEMFSVATSVDATKLRLFVELDVDQVFELDLPFDQFEEIMPNLTPAIQSLHQRLEHVLPFRVVNRQSLPVDLRWIRP